MERHPPSVGFREALLYFNTKREIVPLCRVCGKPLVYVDNGGYRKLLYALILLALALLAFFLTIGRAVLFSTPVAQLAVICAVFFAASRLSARLIRWRHLDEACEQEKHAS